MPEFLNIVDSSDNIIGAEERVKIHTLGLTHREVHVYFMTPNHEFIFQHRAKDKDTFPDLLDATVGGHVEIGQSYKDTAVKETEEETGLKINPKDLVLIGSISQHNSKDEVSNKINNSFRAHYLYLYPGPISDLKIEPGKALGFEVMPLKKLSQLSNDEKKKFIPYVINFVTRDISAYLQTNKL